MKKIRMLSTLTRVTSARVLKLKAFVSVSHEQIVTIVNSTEWSTIRSVFIRVINKIGRPGIGSPICFITSMITNRIGRHESRIIN